MFTNERKKLCRLLYHHHHHDYLYHYYYHYHHYHQHHRHHHHHHHHLEQVFLATVFGLTVSCTSVLVNVNANYDTCEILAKIMHCICSLVVPLSQIYVNGSRDYRSFSKDKECLPLTSFEARSIFGHCRVNLRLSKTIQTEI